MLLAVTVQLANELKGEGFTFIAMHPGEHSRPPQTQALQITLADAALKLNLFVRLTPGLTWHPRRYPLRPPTTQIKRMHSLLRTMLGAGA